MKFSWFHLMPYRYLPADFREQYHSVWVDVPNRHYGIGAVGGEQVNW